MIPTSSRPSKRSPPGNNRTVTINQGRFSPSTLWAAEAVFGEGIRRCTHCLRFAGCKLAEGNLACRSKAHLFVLDGLNF